MEILRLLHFLDDDHLPVGGRGDPAAVSRGPALRLPEEADEEYGESHRYAEQYPVQDFRGAEVP